MVISNQEIDRRDMGMIKLGPDVLKKIHDWVETFNNEEDLYSAKEILFQMKRDLAAFIDSKRGAWTTTIDDPRKVEETA